MSDENQNSSEEAKETAEKEQTSEPGNVRLLKNKLRKREADLKLLKKEKEDLKDKYLRTLAEMENLKKRVEREKSEFYQFAFIEFLKELIIILDNFERALKSGVQGDGKSFREGIDMIYRQYLDLLMRKGVAPIEIKNKKFDPNLHQAFITEESEDIEEPEVDEELQKGYSLHNRLLRPALVKVIIPKKK